MLGGGGVKRKRGDSKRGGKLKRNWGGQGQNTPNVDRTGLTSHIAPDSEASGCVGQISRVPEIDRRNLPKVSA